jgi:hypothetical protein
MEILSILRSGADVAGALIGVAERASSIIEKQKLRNISTALRSFYFTPSGLLAVLQKIAKAETVDKAEFAGAMEKYAALAPEVEKARKTLSDKNIFENLGIELQTANMIASALNLKVSVRETILRKFKEYKTKYDAKQRSDAKAICGGIERLNMEIEKLDRILNPKNKGQN